MIEGVKMIKMVKNMDDRGFFIEAFQDDERLVEKFGEFSMSLSSPGVIKAFHYHKKADDLWSFPIGNAQVVLHDVRDDSPTKGQTNVFYLGENNLILLYIPQGVAHGYRVLGRNPGMITYFTSESYQGDQPDEYFIPWDDPDIGFDWGEKSG